MGPVRKLSELSYAGKAKVWIPFENQATGHLSALLEKQTVKANYETTQLDYQLPVRKQLRLPLPTDTLIMYGNDKLTMLKEKP